MATEEDTMAAAFSRVGSAFAAEARLHVELAKAELRRDAEHLLRGVTPVAVGAGLLGVGYLCGVAALALALSAWVGAPGACALVGAVHLMIGAVTLRLGLRRLVDDRASTGHVVAELQKSLGNLALGPRPRPAGAEVTRVG